MQVVVTGMHRSGTSVITRLLSESGCFLGNSDDLMPAKPDNPTGFWEHLGAFDINVKILAAAGVDWDTSIGGEIEAISDRVRAEISTEILEFVAEMSKNEIWAVKDPRLAMTYPFWRPMLSEPALVWCVRNPLEIGTSLRGRNGFPVDLGVALWEAYTLAGMKNLAGLPVVVASYNELLRDPVGEVSRLVESVNALGGGGLRIPDDATVESIVRPGLCRSMISLELDDEFLTDHRRAVWDVSSRSEGWSEDVEKPGLSALSRDEILRHRQSLESERKTTPQPVHSVDETAGSTDRRDAEFFDSLLAKAEVIDSRVERMNDLLVARNEATQTEIQELERRYVSLSEEHSQLETEVAARNHELETTSHELEVVRAELERHQAALADYRSSMGGRLLDWWWRLRSKERSVRYR